MTRLTALAGNTIPLLAAKCDGAPHHRIDSENKREKRARNSIAGDHNAIALLHFILASSLARKRELLSES